MSAPTPAAAVSSAEGGPSNAQPSPSSDASLYLSLRLQALEALILGSVPASVTSTSSNSSVQAPISSSHAAILRRTLDARTSLDALIEPHKPIRTFVSDYDRNKSLLVPSFPLSSSSNASTAQPSGTQDLQGLTMLPGEKAALVLEAVPELREFERQMSQCQVLDQRGMAAAGRLEEHYALAPQLTELASKAHELRSRHDELEDDVVTQLERYTQLVDTVSELYVEWDQVLTSVERRLTALERAKRQREGEDEA